MIRVQPAPEPPSFHQKVRVPGVRSIKEKTGNAVPQGFERRGGPKFKQRTREVKQADGSVVNEPIQCEAELPPEELVPFWTEALDDLMTAYDQVCAYSCFRIHRVTGARSVDHMVPKSLDWEKAYEWANFRLACSRLNGKKGALRTVHDPFDVHDDWFVIEFNGGQVIPGPGAKTDPALRAAVQETINDLGLNDFAEDRLSDMQQYLDGDVSYAWLKRESPFVARELAHQGMLKPEDLPQP